MSVKLYEIIFVTRPDVTDEAQKRVTERLIELIAEDGGKVLHVDDWGTRKTAYPVQKFSKGRFVQLTFAGSPGVVGKVERILRILDEVMKFFSIKAADSVSDELLQQDIVWTVARRDEGEQKRRSDSRKRDDRRDGRRDDRRRDDRRDDRRESSEAAGQ